MSDLEVGPAEVRRSAAQMEVVAEEASSSRAALADRVSTQEAAWKHAVVTYRGWLAAVVLAVLVATGCGGDDGGYDSPLLNQDVPVVDIADLPDAEQTRAQMWELIERVRAEVTRLVPESDPWRQAYEESSTGCTQQATGRKGVTVYLAKFGSSISFTDEQWGLVYPAVERLAAGAGLTEVQACANSTGNRDIRFHSNDGRTLVFGSREASLLTGSIACRRPAESPAPRKRR